MKTSLGDRMKEYERVPQTRLVRRVPVIIRVDGKAFHTFCKGFDKPFDDRLIACMNETALHLCRNIQGCKLAYIQSDEISLLLTDWDRYGTQSWFDYRVQKMASVTASLATIGFYLEYRKIFKGTKFHDRTPMFDARVANYPRHEVANYFVWRQQDWIRNSVHMVGRASFSQRELHGKNSSDIKQMLFKRDLDWEQLPADHRLGRCVRKLEVDDEKTWIIDNGIPVFTENRDYIERYLTDVFCEEENS